MTIKHLNWSVGLPRFWNGTTLRCTINAPLVADPISLDMLVLASGNEITVELDEEGLELAVKEPPGPVLETEVFLDVPLDDLEGDP